MIDDMIADTIDVVVPLNLKKKSLILIKFISFLYQLNYILIISKGKNSTVKLKLFFKKNRIFF